MNNPLTILFALTVLLALALGLVQALRQAQLKIGYNASAASLYQAVSEYVGQRCGTTIAFSTTLGYKADANCSGVTVPTLVDNNRDVCAARGEVGYIDAGVVDLHGATLEVWMGETLDVGFDRTATPPALHLDRAGRTPPALRLLHGGAGEARGFLAHLASGHGKWLPYDSDGDGVPEGVQRWLQTRTSVDGGLWLNANGADPGCAKWGIGRGPLNDHVKNKMWGVACELWTPVVRDDKDLPCDAGTDACYYPAGRTRAAETWNYGNKRLREDAVPTRCIY